MALICWLVTGACWLAGDGVFAQTKSLVIGIDGLGYGARGLEVASTPNIDSLIEGTFAAGYRGGYSSSAFAGGVRGTPQEQATVSGPGWSTILSGVWDNRHNVTNNNFTAPNLVSNPVYLGLLKNARPELRTASYVNWDPIDTYIISSVDADANPANNMNFRGTYASDIATAMAATAGISGELDPDAIFIHFDEVDGAGHSCGSSGACYQSAIEQVDFLVGLVLASVRNRPNFGQESWQIVLTSDHGHVASGGHGGQSDLERRIPFIVTSRTVRQGTIADPIKAVSHADVSPTVLDHFDVVAPAHYYGVSRASGGGIEGADLDGDGEVTELDWLHFLASSAENLTGLSPADAYALGDMNLDGHRTIADFALFRTRFSAGFGMGSHDVGPPLSVPEPGTSGLLLSIAAISWGNRLAHRSVTARCADRRAICAVTSRSPTRSQA